VRVQCVAECSPGGGGAGRSAGGALVCVLLCLIVVLRGVFYCGVDGGALRCLAVWSAVVLGLREFLVMCCAPVMCGVDVCVWARARSRRVAPRAVLCPSLVQRTALVHHLSGLGALRAFFLVKADWIALARQLVALLFEMPGAIMAVERVPSGSTDCFPPTCSHTRS